MTQDATARAVLFDFGGVLIRMDWDGYDEFGARWNLPPGALIRAFYLTPEWHAIETGQGSWETWQRGVEANLAPYLRDNVAAEVQALLDAWYAQRWQFHHPNLELAQELQAGGARIGVLSNAPDDLRDRFLSQVPLPINWDAIIVSGEVGVRKPGRAIFEIASREIGVPMADCFFIDDLEENVLGAQAAGLRAYHFTRNNYKALRIALRTHGFAV